MMDFSRVFNDVVMRETASVFMCGMYEAVNVGA